jgi:intein/homing endonuclease
VGTGDKLLNKDGRFVSIKNIQLRQKVDENTYRIKPSCSYRTTNFTSEHPIWTGNRGFVNASELTCDDWLEIPNVYLSYFGDYKHVHTTDREKKLAYFYGLFTGDGFTNINGNSYDIYMSIGKDEKELAEFYDDLVLDLFDRHCVHVHKDKELTRRFTNKSLVEELNSTVGTSAYNKRVPDWVKHGSYGVKLAFLQGFLDSDGSVLRDRNNIRINYTSVNLELLEDIQDLLFALEIKNSIVIH